MISLLFITAIAAYYIGIVVGKNGTITPRSKKITPTFRKNKLYLN